MDDERTILKKLNWDIEEYENPFFKLAFRAHKKGHEVSILPEINEIRCYSPMTEKLEEVFTQACPAKYITLSDLEKIIKLIEKEENI